MLSLIRNRPILIFGMAAILGILGCAGTSRPPQITWQRSAPSKSHRWINPLLDCEPYGEQREIRSFREGLQKLTDGLLLGRNAVSVSIYYRDLNNGPWFGINEKEEFLPASLLKVPLMLAVYHEAEASPAVLNETLTVPPGGDLPNSQHFSPSSALVAGSTHTVRSLIEEMARRSDNVATFLLSERFGLQGMHQLYDELGVITDDGVPDRLRVKDYATLFRLLYNASYLNPVHSEEALAALVRSEFRAGITAPLPASIPVAHKHGERLMDDGLTKQLHDCGIVYYPGHPYLLCVMTRGSDWDALSGAIGKVSAAVYRELSSQFPAK